MEFAVFGDLTLSFPNSRGGRQVLRKGLAVDFLGELVVRPVSWVVGLGAVATGFPTPASGARDGTGLEVSEFGDLA